MKRLVVLIILFPLPFSVLFTSPLAQDYFIVNNLTNNSITVTFETAVEPVLFGSKEWYFFTEVGGVPINVSYENTRKKIIAPNAKEVCVYYSPHGSWLTRFENDYYNRLRQIPIMEIFDTIFKSFTISDADGNIIITLSDINEDYFITIKENGDVYIILPVYSGYKSCSPTP
jgi:hypothetical protein